MSIKDIRRHQRTSYFGPAIISWVGANGDAKYARVKCLDVSEGGMRIEAPEAIPVHTSLSLRADRIKFAGNATVAHVTRRGCKFVLGLSLSQALRDQYLTVVKEPEEAVPTG